MHSPYYHISNINTVNSDMVSLIYLYPIGRITKNFDEDCRVIIRKHMIMTRKQLSDIIADKVAEVINSPEVWGEDPQLSIIPTTLLVEIERHKDAATDIEYSDYAIEEDAVEDGDYSEDAADFQSASDPDLYPIGTLIDYKAGKPDLQKIHKLVAKYIPEKEENLYAE